MKKTDTPANIVSKEVSKWLEIEDDLFPIVPLVVAVANCLEGPPVWLVIVAPPSSGKSDLLMGISAIKGVHTISKITPNTFASGMKTEPGENAPSLLTRLQQQGKWLLVFKDLGTLLSLPPNHLNPTLGQLREVYDGSLNADYGTGVNVSWSGKLGFLAGATPAFDQKHKLRVELGERFVIYRPFVPDPGKVAMKTLLRNGDETKRREAISRAYDIGYSKAMALWTALKRDGGDHIAPVAYPTVAALGEFVAEARRPVERDRGRYDSSFEVLPAEGPGRLLEVFKLLHRAAMVCCGQDLELANRLVTRIALDSIPGKRGCALQEIARHTDGLTVETMSEVLECDDNTARRELTNLKAIGLVDIERPGRVDIYHASDLLKDYAARVFLDEFDPDDSLQKLLDLPNNITYERERERVEV